MVTIEAPGQVDFKRFLDGSLEGTEARIATDTQLTAQIVFRIQNIQSILDILSI